MPVENQNIGTGLVACAAELHVVCRQLANRAIHADRTLTFDKGAVGGNGKCISGHDIARGVVKFRAVGQGYAGGLKAMCAQYGINAS